MAAWSGIVTPQELMVRMPVISPCVRAALRITEAGEKSKNYLTYEAFLRLCGGVFTMVGLVGQGQMVAQP